MGAPESDSMTAFRSLLLLSVLFRAVPAQLPGDDGPCGSAAECKIIRGLFWEACGAEHQGVIQRTVHKVADGYVAHTTSSNATIANMLQAHVEAMRRRVHERRPLNTWDPLYAAIFNHSSDIQIITSNLTNGTMVQERGSTACAIAITHAHAGVVDGFIANSMREMMTEHKAPTACPFAGRSASAMPNGHAG